MPYRLPDDYELERGRGVALTEGDDAVLIGYGPVLLPQAFAPPALLRERHGLGLRVVNLPWLNRWIGDWLADEMAARSAVCFTLDDHYVWGGQGEMVAARLAELGLGPRPRGSPLRRPRDPRLRHERRGAPRPRLDAESLAADLAAAMRGGPPD